MFAVALQGRTCHDYHDLALRLDPGEVVQNF